MDKTSWKVSSHPRGHVAHCNGSLDLLKTRVEQYPNDPCLTASERAQLVNEWTEKETERKSLKLAQFQKEVKFRVSAREKQIQQEMVAATSKAMDTEQAIVDQALKLDDTKVRRVSPHAYSVAVFSEVYNVRFLMVVFFPSTLFSGVPWCIFYAEFQHVNCMTV